MIKITPPPPKKKLMQLNIRQKCVKNIKCKPFVNMVQSVSLLMENMSLTKNFVIPSSRVSFVNPTIIKDFAVTDLDVNLSMMKEF